MANDFPNPWLREQRGVTVWAHRGGGHEFPSNTIYAMKRSSANGLELDLQATADLADDSDDGVVVFHDDVLENTTDGRGLVSIHTYGELAALDAAHWWTPGRIHDHDAEKHPLRGKFETDAALRIPRLVDVLEAFPETPLNLDLKQPGMEAKVAELLKRFGRTSSDVIVASFSERRVRKFKTHALDAATAPGFSGTLLAYAGSRIGKAWNPGKHLAFEPPTRSKGMAVDRRFVDAAHRNGVAVNVWTVNHPKQASQLLELGVDGIVTDRPKVIGPIVAEFNEQSGFPTRG